MRELYVQRVVSCEMRRECTAPVTHIGDKGYVYCAEHAQIRRASGYEHCRRLRQWELRLLRADVPLPSYKPLSEAQTMALIEARAAPKRAQE